MKVETLSTDRGVTLEGPLLLTPKTFSDSRGFFFESWNQRNWLEFLARFEQIAKPFVQDNHSCSFRGVLRGLHYQLNPYPQDKLVRCIVGEIFDVAVDLRQSSPTFSKWAGAHLSAENYQQLWVPAGFAHGFLTLSDQAEVLYKTTDFWSSDCERSIRWDDPRVKLDWPDCGTSFSLSDKDLAAPMLSELVDADLFV